MTSLSSSLVSYAVVCFDVHYSYINIVLLFVSMSVASADPLLLFQINK